MSGKTFFAPVIYNRIFAKLYSLREIVIVILSITQVSLLPNTMILKGNKVDFIWNSGILELLY
jgi:hypothetical protein